MGNEESSMNFKDNVYPFRQDSNFLYFFGIDQPDLAAIIDIDEQKTILFGDDRSVEHIVWMGPQPLMADQAKAVGVEHTSAYSGIDAYLAEAVKKERKVHYLPPYRPENIIKLHQWLNIPLKEIGEGASEDLIKAVVAQASIKNDEEVAEMEIAVNISRAMHIAAIKAARPGIKEAQITGIVEGIASASEVRTSYPVILSKDGQILHNHHHGNTLKSGQLVLGDFGAESKMHYAGDLTRTFPVDKKFTEKQKAIYNIVLEAEDKSIEALKPGVKYIDVHLFASKIITEGLQALGIMKGDVEASINAGAHGLFFPHGLGHMIGLDVHDMEDLGENYVGYAEGQKRSDQFGLRSLRMARELEPGHVITVEPGIYFIPELIDQWEAEKKHADFINYDKLKGYRDFGGIRIEDNVLITKDGYRVLGDRVPKTVEEIEALRS
jgi:Xaa-Pro aminopeptidase